MTDEELDDEFEELMRRFAPSFAEGFIAGRLGKPGSLVIGGIEGVRDGNVIRWEFPDHQWAEARLYPDGALELFRNDRLIAQLGPVTLEDDEDPEPSSPPE